MRIETGHKFLRLVNPIQITRGPPSTENQCRLGQWHTERNPPTIHYNQCQQLGTTSQYYRQHQFLRLVLFSSTGSRGSKSQTNTIVINIRPNQALAWNSKCQFQLQWFTWPDPVVLLFKGSMQKPMQTRLGYCVDILIGPTYSCLGGQTQGGKNSGILNSPSGWLKECSFLILNQNRSEPLVPVHRTVDLFTMNTLCVRDRPKSTDRVNGRGIILLVKFHFTNHGLYI